MLDAAFEEEGFCIVRGPDLLWGGDIRRFFPPAGRFEGVVGGPPCQRFSGLGKVNMARWGEDSVMPDMIPDFSRVVEEAAPWWFVMENVPGAPPPVVPSYDFVQRLYNNRWTGAEQDRERRFTFGVRRPVRAWDALPAPSFTERFHLEQVALEAIDSTPTVVSTGQADWKGSAQRNRASVEYMARQQGLDPARFEHSPFTVTELRRAIANGVPLPMGRAVARAVKRAMNYTMEAA